MQFKFNNKHKQRRSSSNNIYGLGKSSCRVAVTPRTLGSFLFPFINIQGSFSNCSTKAKKVKSLNNKSLEGSLT